MTDIIGTVTQVITNGDVGFKDPRETAKAAIRATLEHYRNNVSDAMRAPVGDLHCNLDTQLGRDLATHVISAVISQALSELES